MRCETIRASPIGSREWGFEPLFGSVGTRDDDGTVIATACYSDAPRVTADLAVLHERATHVRFDVDLDLLAAVRARDQEAIVHLSSR
jgi:hypothetical protein